MPFNVHDKQSVSAAQDAGLSKAREISEALILLSRQGAIKLGSALANLPKGLQRSPGEDANDIDPNITNEQHDLYVRTLEEYRNNGVDEKTAKAAALDFAVIGLGANESPNIQSAHDQISQTYSNRLEEGAAEVASFLSLRQRLVAAGVDVAHAKSISKARDHEIGAAMREAEGNPDPPLPLTTFEELIADSGLTEDFREYFIHEFETEIALIKGQIPEKLENSVVQFLAEYPPNPELESDNPDFTQLLIDDGVSQPIATKLTEYREAVRSYTIENNGVVPMGALSAFEVQLKAAGVNESLQAILKSEFEESIYEIIEGKEDLQSVETAPTDPYQSQFTFRQRLIDAGLDSDTATAISNQRDVELELAEGDAREGLPSPGESLPNSDNSVQFQLSQTSLPEPVRQSFLKEFQADIAAAIERGQHDYSVEMMVENGPALWEQYGFSSAQEAQEEYEWLRGTDEAEEEISSSDLQDLDVWASTEDVVVDQSDQENEPTTQPVRSRKIAQAQAQSRINDEASVNEPSSEVAANSSASDSWLSDGESDDSSSVTDTSATRRAYQDKLEDAGSSPQTSKQAAQDLADGKGALDSPAVYQAHKEVLAHRYLRDMYERVYASLDVNPTVGQLAAKDAAKGLGANTSSHIREAHEMAQANQSGVRTESETNVSPADQLSKNDVVNDSQNLDKAAETNVSPGDRTAENDQRTDAQNWKKYSQLFIAARAEKYPGDNSQVSEYATLKGAAVEAFKANESPKTVQAMLQNSPMNNPPSGDQLVHAQEIAVSARSIAKQEMDGTSRVRPRPLTREKGSSLAVG